MDTFEITSINLESMSITFPMPFTFELLLKVCSQEYRRSTRETVLVVVAVALCEWALNILTLNLRLSTIIKELDIKKTA